jgi:hypothetical protein
MKTIFEQAEPVIIFLGPEADESHKVMDFLERIGRIVEDVEIDGISRKEFVQVSKNLDDAYGKDILAKPEQCYEKMDRLFYDEFPADAYEAFVKRPGGVGFGRSKSTQWQRKRCSCADISPWTANTSTMPRTCYGTFAGQRSTDQDTLWRLAMRGVRRDGACCKLV